MILCLAIVGFPTFEMFPGFRNHWDRLLLLLFSRTNPTIIRMTRMPRHETKSYCHPDVKLLDYLLKFEPARQ
jgi:hypothetical protein